MTPDDSRNLARIADALEVLAQNLVLTQPDAPAMPACPHPPQSIKAEGVMGNMWFRCEDCNVDVTDVHLERLKGAA